jgi:diphthine synthase
LGRLIFVGLGIRGVDGIPVKGLKKAKEADKVYAEFYTSPSADLNVESVSRFLGKPVFELKRVDLEDKGGKEVLDEASKGTVVLLVPGDPMIATTHLDLRLKALKSGIKVEIVHASSIYSTAASASGLQIYKFGKTVTIPFPSETYMPETPYEVVKENLERGLHSLVLLDCDAEADRWMTIREGLEYLLKIEEKRRENMMTSERLAVGLAGLGGEDAQIVGGKISRLLKVEFKLKPQTIIIPGKLHFMEAEALKVLAQTPEEELGFEA